MKFVMFFDFSDLFAKRGLGYVQSVGGARETQLLGQHYDRVQMTYFDLGEHCSKPPCTKLAEIGSCPTSSQGTDCDGKVSEKKCESDGADPPRFSPEPTCMIW
jgi:hypothetical protein